MFEIIEKIIPIILIFLLGYFLKSTKLLKEENASLFLKVVFYISLPALIILSSSSIKLSADLIYLPLAPLAIIFITFFVSFLIGRLLNLPRPTMGVLLTGTMIMNMGFLLPFFIAAYGNEGLAMASLFDFGNGLLAYTLVYFLACKYGNNSYNAKAMLKKFIVSPPLWALAIAILLNLLHIKTSVVVNNFFQLLGNLTLPLIMLSLGIYFKPKITKFMPLSFAVLIRMFLGLLLGYAIVSLLNINGLSKSIILISSAAPIGYNTLTFASMEKLDIDFAASIVSYSLLIGIIITPLLLFLLN